MSDLGALLGNLVRAAEAESLVASAVAIRRAANGDDNPRVAGAMNSLAAALHELDQPARAASPSRAGPPHSAPRIRWLAPKTQSSLAAALDDQGKHGDTLAMQRDALARLTAALGPDHPTVAYARHNLGATYHDLQRHEQSITSFAEAARIRRAALGTAHSLTVSSLVRRGQCEVDAGLLADAERSLDATTQALEQQSQPDARAREQLQLQRRRLDSARALLRGR
ncbi:MAG: tetratricopeptide repeat protein [Gemmatimonadetes bacterium]|nr:tetratricopeptide repeat protein [Gemmatimonadota bacterium]